MKKIFYISPLICTLVLVLNAFTANAQNVNVFQWVGGSGQWSDVAHWEKNGIAGAGLPSQSDAVFIKPTTGDISIELSASADVAAFYTAGNHAISFHASENIDLNVNGTCIMSPATEIDENIQLNLKGIGANTWLQIPQNLNANIQISKKANYKKISNLPKGGACPYFTIVPNPTAPTCNGFSDGIASVLEPPDGVGPYTYQWVGGPSAQQWTNLSAGTYTVFVIDAGQGGLLCSEDVFVNEPGPLTVFSMNASPPLCADVCNGTATPIVIGGNGGYNFTWSSGETGANASMLCPTFNLVIEDTEGCTFDTTYTFANAPDTIKFDAAITDVDCFGNNNGAIDVTISGGVGAFTPTWSGPNGFSANTEDISGLEAGEYTISVTDGNNCLADSTFTISENPPLTATSSKTDNGCADGTEGSITITPSGGSGTYSYSWTGPNGFSGTDQTISNLESGTYEVTVTDDAFCTTVLQVTIDEPTPIVVDITSTDVLCAGGATGAATASASGGTPAYTYSWSGPNGFSNTGPAISDIAAGTYIVSVTDGNSCLKTDSIAILQPDSIQLTFNDVVVTCHDGSDGSIDLEIAGGMPPYSVTWSGSNGFTSTDEDISNLSPGIYTATVEDGNNCSTSGDVEILNPATITLGADITNTTCATGNTGAIDLTVNGGVEPYTFAWTGPGSFSSTDEDISGLSSGTYAVTATDASGCDATGSFDVDAPDALTATFTKENASCFGTADGSITTAPAGGTPPYSFLWIGPSGFFSTDQNISGLLAGNYSLQILDAAGCAGFLNVTLSQPPKIVIANTVTTILCHGESTGAIDVLVSGGTPDYTYSWTGPDGFTSTQADLSNIPAGDYSLVVTDAIGCTSTRDFTITEPDEITVDETIQDVVCTGDSNGSISVAVANGVSPYSYSWTGPSGFTSTDENISGLLPGDYTLTVTDANMCSVENTYTVAHTVTLIIDASVTNVTCFSDSDGAIDAAVSGGEEPYQINWAGPNGFISNDPDISGLTEGEYTVSVTDNNGCELMQTFSVTQPDELLADITKTDILCAGDDNGSLSANISGGTTPYSISWTGPNGFSSSDATIDNLIAGNYSITVTDAHDCSVSASAEIINPDSIQVDIQVTQPSCLVDNGELSATVSGGVIAADYGYVWTDSGGNQLGTNSVLSGLAPGIYTLTVSDDNGCTVVTETELVRIVFNVSAALEGVTCYGSNDGSISVSPTNGTPPFSYSWSGPNGFTSTDSDISGLVAGDYLLSVEDGAGCQADLSYEVGQPDSLSTDADITPISCLGEENGAIELNISGGTSGYSVNWMGPNGFTGDGVSISGLEAGTYTATVSDANGCAKDTSVVLDPGFDFTISLNPSNPLCANEANGSIDAEATSVSGAPGNYTFEWSGPDGYSSTDQNISNLTAGTYIVSVTSEAGCLHTDTTELISPEPIEIITEVFNSNCGLADGSAVASVSGGSEPYQISWLDNANNPIVSGDSLLNVAAGFYTVQVTDSAGCQSQEMVTISDDAGTIDQTAVMPTCYGGDDGAIDITITSGTEPITYQWTDGSSIISTNEDLTGITAGTYSLLATDANGCTFSIEIDLFNPDPITAAASTTGVSCNGSDGVVSLAVENADEPFTIDWSGPNGFTADGDSLSGLEAGMYYFTINDNKGCSMSDSVSVVNAPALTLDASITNIICGGDSSGVISLSISGGTAPYQVEWTGDNGFSASTASISNLPAGDYTAQVTDATGCGTTQTFSVTENPPILVDFDIVNPDCNTDNGSISATITGGVVASGYLIQWSDQAGNTYPSQAALTDLPVGIYNFTASDDNGCAFDTTIVLTNPAVTVVVNKTDIACAGMTSGAINLTITDAAEPYSVAWTGPNGYVGSGENLLDLETGEYTYNVTDANGCTSVGIVEITAPEPLLATATTTNTCFGDTSGTIDLTISGGTPEYTISWTGPNGFASVNEDLNDLEPGMYALTITDDNGCLYANDYEILENAEIELSASVTDIVCNGTDDGQIDLSVSGGQQPYEINWSGPGGFVSDQDSISGLAAGEYSITITDNIGCGLDSMFTITQPDSIRIDQTVIAAGCSSPGSLGSIELTVSGGTPNYGISWTGPDGFTANTFSIEDLEAGTYLYIITDNAGCQKTDSIAIPGVTPLLVELTGTNISCYGGENGTITTTVSGGIEPYSYSWTGPDGLRPDGSDLTDLPAGTYILTLTDSAGCSTIANIELLQPDSIQIDLGNTVDASCNTSNDGAISPVISGGTEPYNFAWGGPDGFSSADMDISNLSAGTYAITVTDSNLCTDSAQATLNYTLEISANVGPDQLACESDLPLHIAGSGENVDAFVWTDLAGDTLSTDSILSLTDVPGTHVYIFTAGNGMCSAQDTLQVEILESPEADAGPDHEVFAEEVFTLGGNPTSPTATSYLWSPNPNEIFDTSVPNPTGSVLESTTFTVHVKDANGCTGTDTVFVEVLPKVVITSGFTPNDDGINDTWIIDNMELFPDNVVQIFDRWGIVLYSKTGYNSQNAWDGTYEGKAMPVGTYYYTIQLNDPRFPDPYTGPITIYR